MAKKLTRKERRKKERLKKKAKKHQFFMKKCSIVKEKSETVITDEKKSHFPNKQFKSRSKRAFTKKSVPTAESIRKIQLKEAVVEDEKVIHRLEKQLKLRNKKKIPKTFFDDGLGYLLEVIDQPEESLMVKKNISEKIKSLQKKSKNEESKTNRLESEYSESEVSTNENSEMEVDNDNESDDDDDNDNSEGNNYAENINGKNKIWEDIYGRLRDKKGNIIKQDSDVQKYVPPAKQLSSESSQKQDELKRIRRQLKGLLNRLSEANMQPISSQVEEVYMKYSRNDINETLCSLIIESIVSTILTAERLIMEHAMLIALLHGNIGEEIGAHFIQTLVCKLDQLFNHESNYGEGKICDNLICLIVHLFTFQVINSLVVYDILNKLIESFQEKDIELILLILRSVGFALRKDNPSSLKEIILKVQNKATSVSTEENQSRIRFMLETLNAIRNNNMYKIHNYDPSLAEHMRKLIRTFLRKGHCIQELRISYNDLLKAEKGGGRWWIVGSAWNDESQETNDNPEGRASLPENNYNESLVKLAKAYRMNTDLRRTIFCIIASAEDYLEAFSKLMRLNLKGMQYREIIVVVLDCCLQQREFNPYYAVLAEKFCKHGRQYRMTLQCSIWDKIKYINELSIYQRNNLADFLIHCFVSDALNITVLKVMNFSDLDAKMMKFLQRIFRRLLLKCSDEDCLRIFQKIPRDQKQFKESIRLFIIMFLNDDKQMIESKLSLLELSSKS